MKRASIILFTILLVTFGASYAYNTASLSKMSVPYGSIAVDSEGRFYALGSTDSRVSLIRVGSSNIIDYYYSARINTADTLLLFGDIFADTGTNRIYSVKNTLDNKSNRFISSSIVYFDTTSKGGEPQTLYEQKFDSGDPSSNQYINHIYPSDGFLYFTTVSEDLRNVVFCRLDTRTQTQPEVLLNFQAPENSLVNTALCKKDFIVVQTMDSKIYSVNTQGPAKTIFPVKGYDGRYFPLNLCLDDEGNLHFNEIYSHDTITMDVSTGNILSVVKSDIPVYPGSSYLQSDISGLFVLNKNTSAVLVSPESNNSSPIPIVVNNGDAKSLAGLKLSQDILLLVTAKTALAVFVPIALALMLILLLRFIFIRRPTLLMKLLVFVLPIIVVAMFLFSRVATYIFNDSITSERMGLVKSVGSFVAQNVDTQLLSQINMPQDMLTPAYDKLLKSISKISAFSEFLPEDPYYAGLYCVLMRVEQDKIYTAVSADMPCFVPLGSLYSQDSMELYRTALTQKNMVTGTIQDVQGSWTVSILPIFNPDGEIVGMLESGINSKDLEASMLNLSRSMILSGIAVSFAVLLAFFIALKILLRPLALLKEAVVSVYNGNYGTLAVIKANDEVADIGRVFNKLSLELNTQFKKLTNLNEAYYKLVPPDTFSLLKKNSILDVRLGDQVSIKMTLMNAAIRNFEKVTSDLSPEVTFAFVNRIFKIISSNTGNYSGTIHSYNVDKVIALFQNSAENALQSVICIRSELSSKSGSLLIKNGMKTDAGFYIHTTACIYGIVGDENRYSPAVVSENNDIVYALDNLQHRLMSSILVTQNAYDEILHPDEYNHRYIGYMTDGNNLVRIGLYEFFDGDDPLVLTGKKQTLEIFKTAISAYMDRDFYRARNLFAQIVKVNIEDTVAKWFLFKCDVLCKQSDEENPELAIAKY